MSNREERFDGQHRRRRFRWLAVGLVGVTVLTVASRTVLANGPTVQNAVPASPKSSTTIAAVETDPMGDLSWKPFLEVVWLPYSASSGPSDVSGGRARGFAHTEFGATLAALHIAERASTAAGPAVFRRTLAEQVTGNDAAAFVRNTEATYQSETNAAGVIPGAAIPASGGAVIAYRVEGYTAHDAVVHLLLAPSSEATRFVDLRCHVQWHAADWILVAPSGGRWSMITSILPSIPQSYTRFQRGTT